MYFNYLYFNYSNTANSYMNIWATDIYKTITHCTMLLTSDLTKTLKINNRQSKLIITVNKLGA